MTITIDESRLNGLNAILTKLNAPSENPSLSAAEVITAEQYLTDRVNDMLASYDAQLIVELKKQYDDVITVAANLPAEKQQQAIAFIQSLATEE